MNRQLNIDAALDSRIAALYCRLSRDDELQGDSNTQFFVDDGYSGTTFTRPDWQRLISMVDEGRVGTLIVKDCCAIMGLNQKDLENQGILA